MKPLYDMELKCADRTLCSGISIGPEAEGKCILLCGANGSGKTTLLRHLAEENKGDVSMIPTGIPKVKGFTLRDFVATACYRESHWDGRIGKELSARINEALKLMGIEGKAAQDIATLSDGEFQKACIAVALTSGHQMLLLDEPTAFLDPENRISVLKALRSIADSGKTVVFSSHDLSDSMNFCNEVWAIGRDKRFHKGSTEGKSVIFHIFENYGFQ